MAEISDFFGIGKGAAQIVDQRPMQNFLAEDRAYNRKVNADKVAKKASKAAAIDSLDDKLKNESWSRHFDYNQKKLDDIHNYAIDSYSKYGENVFVDDNDKKAEWEGMINDFVKSNQQSKLLTTEANKNLARAQKINELEPESAGEFNRWLDLSPEQQLSTPMPLLKDREYSLGEVVDKNLKTELSALGKPKKSFSTKADKEGKFSQITITGGTDQEIKDLASKVVKNKNSVVGQKAIRDAAEEINRELVPETIIENGKEVDNPEFLDAISSHAEQLVFEEIRGKVPQQSKEQRARFVPGAGKEKVELNVSEVTTGEKGWQTEGLPTKTIEKTNVDVSNVATDPTGKKYYKLQQPIVVIDGKATKDMSRAEEGTVYDIGVWIDNDFNEKGDTKNLTAVKEFKDRPVKQQFNIESPEKATIKSKYYIDDDGTKVKITDATVLEGATILDYKETEVNESEDKVTFSDEKGFKDKNKTSIETVLVKAKGGTFNIPVTDALRQQYPETFNMIKDKKDAGVVTDPTSEQYNNLKSGDKYIYQGKEYTKE